MPRSLRRAAVIAEVASSHEGDPNLGRKIIDNKVVVTIEPSKSWVPLRLGDLWLSGNAPFEWKSLGISVLITVLVLVYSAFSFRRMERHFADVI